MNSWLVVSLIIVAIAIVVLIGSIVIIISPVKKTMTILMFHIKNIQRQVEGLQEQATVLSTTINRINQDVQFKKDAVQSVVTNVKEIGTTITALQDSSYQVTMSAVKRANADKARQIQTEQWKNIALGILKRYA